MKRGILVLLFILLLVCSVNAMTVELVSPSNGLSYQDVSSRPLTCTATITPDIELLDNLTLYIMNNQTGGDAVAWHPVETKTPVSGAPTEFTVNGLVNGTYTWNCLAVSNNTNEGGEGNQETWDLIDPGNNTFEITFTTAAPPASDVTPPVCSQSDTNITVNEDSGSWTLDSNMSLITNNISCTDANALTYTISSQTGSGGTFSLSNNDMLNFATDANATGTKVSVIKVSDGTSANDIYVSAQVIVSAVNDPPLASVIPNQNWDQNKNKTISLSEYFSDVDDTSLNYSYAFNSSSSHISAVIKDDGDAVLTPESNWYGSETITFTAYDNANLSFTGNEVTLTVQQANTTSANNPPSIDTISPTTDPTILVGGSQTFSITNSDLDDDSMNVTWYVDGVSQEGETSDSFTYTASIVGSFVIKVAISDGKASDTNSWALTVKSSQTTNQTAPPANKKTGENVTACGDNKCSSDEDQLSCCSDCGCPEGYTCNDETNKCTKEKKTRNIILLAVVLGLFVGGAGVGLYLYKKKQEQEIFGGLANTPFSLPPKGGEVKREELIVKKPQEPVKKAERHQEKPLKDTKTTSQVLLKNFIITNLKKGRTLDQIKEELHKVGWTDEQINDAYTAAQLDEAFS